MISTSACLKEVASQRPGAAQGGQEGSSLSANQVGWGGGQDWAGGGGCGREKSQTLVYRMISCFLSHWRPLPRDTEQPMRIVCFLPCPQGEGRDQAPAAPGKTVTGRVSLHLSFIQSHPSIPFRFSGKLARRAGWPCSAPDRPFLPAPRLQRLSQGRE